MNRSLGDILGSMGLNIPVAPATEDAPPAAPREGCEPWCGGGGFKRLGMDAFPLEAGVVSYADTMRAIEYAFCGCEAGQAAKRRHQQALEALTAREVERRQLDALRESGLPPGLCRYEIDDYLGLANAKPALVEMLRRWQVASRQHGTNLLVRGEVGTYKTTLVAALLREEMACGRSGRFLVVDDFLQQIRASYRDESSDDDKAASEWTMVRAAAAADVLVLDDVSVLTDWGRRILFSLLNERDVWERSTVITTNLERINLETSLGKRSYDRFGGGAICRSTGEEFVVGLRGASGRGRSPFGETRALLGGEWR